MLVLAAVSSTSSWRPRCMGNASRPAQNPQGSRLLLSAKRRHVDHQRWLVLQKYRIQQTRPGPSILEAQCLCMITMRLMLVQRNNVVLDACMLGTEDSAFLQQAAHLSGGIYLRLRRPGGMLQTLLVSAGHVKTRAPPTPPVGTHARTHSAICRLASLCIRLKYSVKAFVRL